MEVLLEVVLILYLLFFISASYQLQAHLFQMLPHCGETADGSPAGIAERSCGEEIVRILFVEVATCVDELSEAAKVADDAWIRIAAVVDPFLREEAQRQLGHL